MAAYHGSLVIAVDGLAEALTSACFRSTTVDFVLADTISVAAFVSI